MKLVLLVAISVNTLTMHHSNLSKKKTFILFQGTVPRDGYIFECLIFRWRFPRPFNIFSSYYTNITFYFLLWNYVLANFENASLNPPFILYSMFSSIDLSLSAVKMRQNLLDKSGFRYDFTGSQAASYSQTRSPWLGDIVDSGIGLSYRPARLHRYDNIMPELAITPPPPRQGLRIWLVYAFPGSRRCNV